MTAPSLLSLCSGIGGLDLAAEQLYGAKLRAYAEIDPAARTVMDARFPGVPNLGDIKAISDPGRFDIVTAGFPCQDISNAGHREGLNGERSGLWWEVLRVIGVTRPRLVLIENVAAILRRGGTAVVRSLAETGYDTQWITVRASDAAGACHPRNRWFCIASARDTLGVEREWRTGAPGQSEEPDPLGNADRAIENADGEPWLERRGAAPGEAQVGRTRADPGRRDLLPAPLASDADHGGPNARFSNGSWKLTAIGNLPPDPDTWGPYTRAIVRHQHLVGRPAPNPHDVGPRGGLRVSAPFVEWMMSYPEGWVTDPRLGLTYRQQMRCLGNAVMPQHAVAAISMMKAA